MKARLVIVNCQQFGYNTATYYYCKHLRDRYDIIYLGWDQDLEKIKMTGIEIVYIKRKQGVLRIINYLQEVLRHTKSNRTIIFIKYFRGMNTIIRLFRSGNPLVLDIRTGSVECGRLKRWVRNALIKLESKFFRNVTVISKSLSVRLGLDPNSSILPLGADVISKTDKDFYELRLLYVGTLYNRNIHKTIEGVAKLITSIENPKITKYTIIGTGFGDEVDQLRKLIEQHNLQDIVYVLGHIPHNQLRQYFNSHNVGIAYIPMTDYYDVQPPTKTFEYLRSGLAVLGTATLENKLVITETNGVLTGDSSSDFSDGLVRISKKLNFFESSQIRKDALQFSWENITTNLDVYLQTLL